MPRDVEKGPRGQYDSSSTEEDEGSDEQRRRRSATRGASSNLSCWLYVGLFVLVAIVGIAVGVAARNHNQSLDSSSNSSDAGDDNNNNTDRGGIVVTTSGGDDGDRGDTTNPNNTGGNLEIEPEESNNNNAASSAAATKPRCPMSIGPISTDGTPVKWATTRTYDSSSTTTTLQDHLTDHGNAWFLVTGNGQNMDARVYYDKPKNVFQNNNKAGDGGATAKAEAALDELVISVYRSNNPASNYNDYCEHLDWIARDTLQSEKPGDTAGMVFPTVQGQRYYIMIQQQYHPTTTTMTTTTTQQQQRQKPRPFQLAVWQVNPVFHDVCETASVLYVPAFSVMTVDVVGNTRNAAMDIDPCRANGVTSGTTASTTSSSSSTTDSMLIMLQEESRFHDGAVWYQIKGAKPGKTLSLRYSQKDAFLARRTVNNTLISILHGTSCQDLTCVAAVDQRPDSPWAREDGQGVVSWNTTTTVTTTQEEDENAVVDNRMGTGSFVATSTTENSLQYWILVQQTNQLSGMHQFTLQLSVAD